MKYSLLLAAVALTAVSLGCTPRYTQPELGARKVEILTEGKFQFKDLNKNGKLDPYEDWRLPMEERIADLVRQMGSETEPELVVELVKEGRVSEERINQAATYATVVDVVFGRHHPQSKLPFEIPSSMDAVRAQLEDVPFDSPEPSFPFGFGLTY